MISGSDLLEAIRRAWSPVPAPPLEDLRYMAWGWGEKAYQAFAGVAPMEVDTNSVGFFAATPLLDLPPRAAAAYFGTYLRALVADIEQQRAIGIYSNVTLRAHTVTCLELPSFWEETIRPHLPAACREVLVDVIAYLTSEPELVPLTTEQVDKMRMLGNGA